MSEKTNTIGERIKLLRDSLGLSMEAFGEKIGVTRSSIFKLEKSENSPAERTLKLICSVYNVNDYWLRDGIGDMFLSTPDTIIDELAIEYNLNDFWKETLRKFLNMNDDEKDAFEGYLKKLFNIE